MKIGIFAGSFDPFTIGHASIVRRALPLFDKIVIGVGINERKNSMLNTDEKVKKIALLYANEPKIEVKAYSDLTVSLAHREHAQYFIKGVRSVKDFEYEREQADINQQIGGIETLFLFTEPELASVSSSLVRELVHFGEDVSRFLPRGYTLKKIGKNNDFNDKNQLEIKTKQI